MGLLDTLSKVGTVALDIGTKAAQAGLLKVKELGYQTQKSQTSSSTPAPRTVSAPPSPPPANPGLPGYQWGDKLKQILVPTIPAYPMPQEQGPLPPVTPKGGPADQGKILILLGLGALVLFSRRR